ncbi:hypothetical protein IMCC26134_08455 [Verrucomicrobia bacterium IMCC26134]|nr:hypothetical protein IMCC26134_08455 [Verrucomicrobia bacterium IMCC26134]
MSETAPKRPIFILTHEFDPRRGGIATFCEEIALAAHEAGHPVEVWTHLDSAGKGRSWPFTVRRLDMTGTHGVCCRLATLKALIAGRKRLQEATLLLAEPGPMMACFWLLPFIGLLPRSLRLTFHGSEILRFHADPFTRLFTRALIRRAERISTLTEYTRDLLCTRFPAAAGKTVLTPGAVHSAPQPSAAAGLPPSTGTKRLVVLTVGRLHPRKGQLQTLQALAALPAELRDQVEYWIVGRASGAHYEHQLQLAAAATKLRTRFLGELHEAQLDLVYRRADIFALTSIDHGHSVEGFGLVYLDACARGLPIVAHRIGGVPEAVADNITGLLVPPGRPEELTAAFKSLITDPVLRRRLAEAGPAWSRKHSWQTSVRALFEPATAAPPRDIRTL